jgi:hypothetical protein
MVLVMLGELIVCLRFYIGLFLYHSRLCYYMYSDVQTTVEWNKII